MCEPATAGLILTAIGGGVKAVNTTVSSRRQDRAAARGIREQNELQRGANVTVNEQIADIAASTGEAERKQALEDFLNVLRDESATVGAPSDPLALGGQRFAERVGAGEAVTRQTGTERAGRLATIGGAVEQRIGEAGRVAGTATELSEVQRRAEAADFITRLRIASKRPNPLINALGTTLQGVGSVVGLGAAGAAGAPALGANAAATVPTAAPNIFSALPRPIF